MYVRTHYFGSCCWYREVQSIELALSLLNLLVIGNRLSSFTSLADTEKYKKIFSFLKRASRVYDSTVNTVLTVLLLTADIKKTYSGSLVQLQSMCASVS
jgi:hypothetical protein